MRKLTLIALAGLLMLTLHACWDNDEANYFAISTVKVIDGKDYYLQLDDGTKMYPSDTTALRGYKVVNGQRAFVYFDYLDNPVKGYDHSIRVEGYSNILTKGIIPITEETADSIGDNRITPTHMWIADGYLTLRFYFAGSYNPAKPHMLNLVQQPGSTPDEKGYIPLEFRHNNYGDHPNQLLVGFVSFKLDEVVEEMMTATGLKIRVKTIEEGEHFFKIDLKNVGESAPSASQLQGAAHGTGTIY